MSDKHAKHKSKYTLDRQIPGAFEGETITRRRFMTGTAHTAGGIAAAAFTLPALGFAVGPIFKSTPHRWETVGTVDQFPDNNYIPVVVTLTPGIGEAGKATIYMRKFNPVLDTDRYDLDTKYIAITSRCAHLGCPVRWFAQSKLFLCPCHGGAYYQDGSRASGPPERGLFEYRYKLTGNSLLIHAGDMPTLATQASCKDKEKPLVQIQPAASETASAPTRTEQWPA